MESVLEPSKKSKAAVVTVTKQWQGHYLATKDAHYYFLENDQFADVSVFCQSKQYQLHRLVLSTGSEYFEQIFSETCIPALMAHPSVVIVTHIRHEILKLIIDYIYKGQVDVKQTELEEFEKSCELLKVRGVGSIASSNVQWNAPYEEDVCPSDYLDSYMSVDNDPSTDELADFKISKSVPLLLQSASRGASKKRRSSFVAPLASPAANSNVLKEKKDAASNNSNNTSTATRGKRASPTMTAISKPDAPAPPKRRRGPRPRSTVEDVPNAVLDDVLDAISSMSDKTPEMEKLVENMVAHYDKTAEKRKPSSKKASAENYEQRMKDFEESLQTAVRDVLEKMPIGEASALHAVSVSAIKRRMKVLKSEKTVESAAEENLKASKQKIDVKEVGSAVNPVDGTGYKGGVENSKAIECDVKPVDDKNCELVEDTAKSSSNEVDVSESKSCDIVNTSDTDTEVPLSTKLEIMKTSQKLPGSQSSNSGASGKEDVIILVEDA